MMGFGYMSGWGFLWMLVFGILVAVPFWRLLPKFGIPSPVAVVAVIPLGALVLLYVMAFRDELGGKGTPS